MTNVAEYFTQNEAGPPHHSQMQPNARSNAHSQFTGSQIYKNPVSPV